MCIGTNLVQKPVLLQPNARRRQLALLSRHHRRRVVAVGVDEGVAEGIRARSGREEAVGGVVVHGERHGARVGRVRMRRLGRIGRVRDAARKPEAP